MSAPAPSVSTTAAPDHSRLGSKQHSDGGWGLVPIQVRSARFASYDVSEFEPVTGLELEWKHTPIDRIKPLVGEELDGSPIDVSSTISGAATVEWVDRTDARVGSAGKPEERASALAWSRFESALVVTLTGDEPNLVTIDRTPGGEARAAHTIVIATERSRGTVILSGSGPAALSENVEIVVEDGAQLTVVTVQEWDSTALHLASHFARVGRDARLRHVVVSLGGSVVRVNPSVHLSSEGGEVELFGAYFADAGQHLEQQVFVNHDAPNTKSRVTYKGALQGSGAHTVWVGDVLIRPTAAGTDSYEQNRNLLLTDGTRADSVPNLEIETGDIAGAGHASASGRFDDEQLFYLQARGIEEHEARRLVVLGFLAEVVQKVGDSKLEQHLLAVIETDLAKGKAVE